MGGATMVNMYMLYDYPKAYVVGDMIYVFGVFMAMCLMVATLMSSYARDQHVSIHNWPTPMMFLGAIGMAYGIFFPYNIAMFYGILVVSYHAGHHGQWIGIAAINIIAWCMFMWCVIVRPLSRRT